jgi:hypothetical protein
MRISVENNTTKASEFRNIFKNCLKVNARSVSIKTLLSDRNLRRIEYKPYYQRNYVWDREKQSFFIESVILGTEIPPLVLFKSGTTIEVIDGRQRFETLKKFKESQFSLSSKGLRELRILKGNNFNKLSQNNQEYFLSANIRVFEFEVINQPNIDDFILDKIKKEIFRRYNTGITPLTGDELDNAKYDTDEFSERFKKILRKNVIFFNNFNKTFEQTKSLDTINNQNEVIISKNIDFIRRYRILDKFPIQTYAGSSIRTETIDLLYDFANSQSDNIEDEVKKFQLVFENIFKIREELLNHNVELNKHIFECLTWALKILDEYEIEYYIDSKKLAKFIQINSDIFTTDSSYHYRKIIQRFETMATYFCNEFDFSDFIRDIEFRSQLDSLKQTEEESQKSLENLSELRLHKSRPESVPIDEIVMDLTSTNYLLRPSYQRQEKISLLKASSIIESILLGISLPPIFIYKRKDKYIKEVVDGQQRILAIIGFLGKQFRDESGDLCWSKHNNFKLKDMKILTKLEGATYSDLDEDTQDKILDFVLDQIIIDEESNPHFDPVDLFIRLNYKPYPIKPNTFEMWNSVVDHEIITLIRDIANDSRINDWFFLRDSSGTQADRMQNEELITILSYIDYKKGQNVIGCFPRIDRLTYRLIDKRGLNDFLVDLDASASEKFSFIESIKNTRDKILLLPNILSDGSLDKEQLNRIFNLKQTSNFRRTKQDFYLLWIMLLNLDINKLVDNNGWFKDTLMQLMQKMKNFNNSEIDEKYVLDFEGMLENLKKQH